MFLFFITDAHLSMIHIFLNSYELLPYGHVILGQEVAQAMLDLFVLCTIFGIKMAFPIIAIEFLCGMGMGMLMKTIPQINVFVIDIQLKIFVGFVLILMFLTPMADFLQNLITYMIENIYNIFSLIQ